MPPDMDSKGPYIVFYITGTCLIRCLKHLGTFLNVIAHSAMHLLHRLTKLAVHPFIRWSSFIKKDVNIYMLSLEIDHHKNHA